MVETQSEFSPLALYGHPMYPAGYYGFNGYNGLYPAFQQFRLAQNYAPMMPPNAAYGQYGFPYSAYPPIPPPMPTYLPPPPYIPESVPLSSNAPAAATQ
jgi:hypothetical protein